MSKEHVDEVYCPELGNFCNGVLQCFDCPYRDEKLEGIRYDMLL